MIPKGGARRLCCAFDEASTRHCCRGGMFVWLKLCGVQSSDSILAELRAENVVIVPGHIFDVRAGGRPSTCPFGRLSCVATVEELTEGVERLARVIRAAQVKQAYAT